MMVVFTVAAQVRPDRVATARAMFIALTLASRTVPGVLSFDILEDPISRGRFVSIEVYQDQAAVDRQAALPELQRVMTAFDGLLTDPPRGSLFHVAAAAPWPRP